jgi:glycosyltransferase involved in cell wall biosynthesis
MHDDAAILAERSPDGARFRRISVVTETYPPEVNGVANTAARFVEGLRRRGHDIELVRPRQSPEDAGSPEPGALEQVLMRGVSIPRYPNLRMGLASKRALLRLWSLHRPDVVHIVTEGPLGWSALRAATQLRLPVVSDFRTNFHAYSHHYGVGWLERPILAYLRKFHNRTLCTMVPTQAMRAELAALGFQRLRVIARGVDTALFDPARRCEALRAAWGARAGDPVFLYVGRLAAEKNLAAVIRAYRSAQREAPRARLVLVGDGPIRDALAAANPDAVFAGMRTGADLAAHYASADVFLFPSLTETWGNVTLEAMASGLAVVAYDRAAAAELIRHDVDGLLAAAGDEKAFLAQAAALAGQPQRIERLRIGARSRALESGWDRVVEQLEAGIIAAVEAGPLARRRGVLPTLLSMKRAALRE